MLPTLLLNEDSSGLYTFTVELTDLSISLTTRCHKSEAQKGLASVSQYTMSLTFWDFFIFKQLYEVHSTICKFYNKSDILSLYCFPPICMMTEVVHTWIHRLVKHINTFNSLTCFNAEDIITVNLEICRENRQKQAEQSQIKYFIYLFIFYSRPTLPNTRNYKFSSGCLTV